MKKAQFPIKKMLRRLFHSNQHEIRDISAKVSQIETTFHHIHLLIAESETRRVRSLPPGTPLAECEFKVSSQFGEDGIIQHLLAHVPCLDKRFVEFGVEDFREANCRYLIEREPWTGLIMDGRPELETLIRGQPISLFRNLHCRSAFITAENINSILEEEKMTGDLGILSIDIDGNDYWVWKAINVARPRIVIAEYNSVFGCTHAVSVPYDPEFQRQKAHYSRLYMGASLPALCHLAKQKNYSFVGSNSAGNNAFFIRNDVLGDLLPLQAEAGFVDSTIRESMSPLGAYTFTEGKARLELIAGMPIVDVITGESYQLGRLID